MSDYFGLEPLVGPSDKPTFYYSSEESSEEEHESKRPEVLPKIERDRIREKVIRAVNDKYRRFKSKSKNVCIPIRSKKPAISLETKMNFYKKCDMYKTGQIGDIDMEFVLKQLKKQKGTCYICKDDVLLTSTDGCRYLISVDRIDNDSPHNKNNCLISCNYCNCRKYMKEVHKKDHKKVCPYKCHILERELPEKETVLKQLIDEDIPERFTW